MCSILLRRLETHWKQTLNTQHERNLCFCYLQKKFSWFKKKISFANILQKFTKTTLRSWVLWKWEINAGALWTELPETPNACTFISRRLNLCSCYIYFLLFQISLYWVLELMLEPNRCLYFNIAKVNESTNIGTPTIDL